MPDNAVSASAKGATSLIALQIISRAITFALNQFLLRYLSPELLGISVQLELYKMGTMYFARESLRVAAERRSDGGIQAAINLSYLAILAGFPISALLAEWYLSVGSLDVAYFSQALRVNQLAALVELLMEPAFTAAQQNLMYGARATAEGASVILKTVTVFSLFFWSHSRGIDLGVLPYAVGELVNSVVLTTVYWSLTAPVARDKKFSLFPRKMKSSPSQRYLLSYFYKPLLWLIGSLFFQTGIKWLLTEGDKLLITALASLEDQGLYALSANYGGLVARMLFQPIEISSRNLFATLCGASSKPSKTPNETSKKGESTTDSSATNDNLQSAALVLRDIIRVYSIFSLIIFAIGPTAAPLLLRLVAGSRWSSSGAAQVLGTYCYYIPFLAINGVSEAFVAATASTKDLRDQTFWMVGFSGLFGLSAYAFVSVLGLGAEGLVWSNCVNMALRVVFNFAFVRRYFAERGRAFSIAGVLPNMYAVGFAVAAPSVLTQSGKIGTFKAYGLFGELVRVGGVAGLLAVAM
ncbi:Rft protein-domain-containing protein [Neohortaea acidophila]|uniref:Man(5)GlcNAc(2)-PP-dolichol translocation protein RFT1 n=1 Tax=Neohortaea acidophila TaxID=245834 RepID=A0A6A6Q469_9PEZI|nr:Rft protein-domain-containing protein [Neohortaea acidophila]KAF2487095.1 Rft protein-domain-containing protein [Neohortaea acidophila]